jgi:GNAT superfamily N-acetyltransferase
VTGPAGQAVIEAFWADRLGCQVADLRRPGVTVVSWPEPFAYALRRQGTLVVAVPARRREAVAARLGGLDPAEAFRPDRLAAVLGGAAGPPVGPAYQGFADAGGARAPAAGDVRALGGADRAALDALRRAAGETAWEHSAIDPERPPLFGRFAGGVLVAAATLEDPGGPVASVGVLTHPAHRGRGHGRAVAGAATRAALDDGAVARYQTLEANLASVAIAHALGYRRDATTLSFRLPG